MSFPTFVKELNYEDFANNQSMIKGEIKFIFITMTVSICLFLMVMAMISLDRNIDFIQTITMFFNNSIKVRSTIIIYFVSILPLLCIPFSIIRLYQLYKVRNLVAIQNKDLPVNDQVFKELNKDEIIAIEIDDFIVFKNVDAATMYRLSI